MKKCIITVFFLVDNFCKVFENWKKNNLLPSSKIRQRSGNLTLSELLAIVLFFYLSLCRDFKNYYIYYLPSKYPNYFKWVSYSRIVQLWQRLILPISIIMYMLTQKNILEYILQIQPSQQFAIINAPQATVSLRDQLKVVLVVMDIFQDSNYI